MSILSVTTINTPDANTSLTIQTGNTSAGSLVLNVAGGLTLSANATSNVLTINSTVSSLNIGTFQVNTSQITYGNLPISANGSLGTAGWVFTTSGANNYWAPIPVPGSNTDILFNDSATTNASAAFTFNKTTNAVSISSNSLTLGTSSVAASGYTFLPNGLILQWGTSTQTTGAGSVTFPIAFPTACFSVTMTLESATGIGTLDTGTVSTSGFSPRSSNTITSTAFWMAIGH